MLKFRGLHIINPAGEPVQKSEITGSRVGRSVHRLLAENVLCSMASISAEGRAHINTAYFCYSTELELYFISHSKGAPLPEFIAQPIHGDSRLFF